MDGIGAIVILAFAALGIWAFSHAANEQAQRRAAAAGALGGAVGQDGRLDVPWGGTRVLISFITSGGKYTKARWTYVEAALPAAYPLSLFLRAHQYEDALQIQRGAMVDVVIGEPAFDAAYLVEGAPADVVRRLLSPQVQAALQRQAPIKLDVVNGVLQVLLSEWQEDAAVLRPWVEVVGSIAGGVRDAYAAADAAIPLVPSGGAYREIPDDQPLQDARAARFAEVQRLGEIRQQRATIPTVVIVVVALMLMLVLTAR